jgi:hypothetical protein
VHPVVAAGLARRAAGLPAARHGNPRAESTHSDVGWPARVDEPPASGSPTGWPGGMTEQSAQPASAAPVRSRGWRRFFGSRAA